MKLYIALYFLVALVSAIRSRSVSKERKVCKMFCRKEDARCNEDDCQSKRKKCFETCDKDYIKTLAVKKQKSCKSLCGESNEAKSKCLGVCDDKREKNDCQLGCAIKTEQCITSAEKKKTGDLFGRISNCYAEEADCYNGSVCENEREFSFSSYLKEETKGECQRKSSKCDDAYIKQVAEKKMKRCKERKRGHCNLVKIICKTTERKSEEVCMKEESKCFGECEEYMKKTVCQMKCAVETGKCTERKEDEKRIDRASRLSQCYKESSDCNGKCL